MKNKKPELVIQSKLVSDCRLLSEGQLKGWDGAIPELALLHSSLNGVRLRPRQVVEQSASGMLSGIPDLFLPVGRDGYLGFFIEMKSLVGTISPAQKRMHLKLRSEGYRVDVHKIAAEALVELARYCLCAPTYAKRS